MKYELAVVGGSGLYQVEGLEIHEERVVQTPFGMPSDSVVLGTLAGTPVAFLARHGRNHQFNPTHVPYQANIWALKSLGVRWLVSVSAVGSLKAELPPRDVVIPDQIIDRTKCRDNSFFDPVAVHVAFADPYCAVLSDLVEESTRQAGINTHRGGTYVCMEGPLFSTRAESNLYRSWGASLIGMTALPEAKLAREAEIAYSAMCFVTDYDCWHEQDVTVEMVIANLQANTANAAKALKHLASQAHRLESSPCHQALKNALMTPIDFYPPHLLDKVELFLQPYL